MSNPVSIGAFEAKTKFSELLERVSRARRLPSPNTRNRWRGLVPFEKPSQVELAVLFRQMEGFRAGHPLNPKGMEKVSYRDLIDGGRKR